MGLNNFLKYMVLVLILSGCAASKQYVKANSLKGFEEGYRKGVEEQLNLLISDSRKMAKPIYGYNEPMVQTIVVPAHVSKGMFIPEHEEMVIVRPGEWRKFEYKKILDEKVIKEKRIKNEKSNKQNYSEPFSVDITSFSAGHKRSRKQLCPGTIKGDSTRSN